MAGQHHQCSEHDLGQTLGDGEGQRSGMLQSMGSQRVNTTGRLNSNKKKLAFIALPGKGGRSGLMPLR